MTHEYCFSGYFVSKPELPSCPLNSQPPVSLIPSIFVGQAKMTIRRPTNRVGLHSTHLHWPPA